MICVVTTGGTIEGLEYDNEDNQPRHFQVNIVDLLETPNLSFEYNLDIAFSKDSRFITDRDRTLLTQKIELSKACKRASLLIALDF